MEPDWKRDSTSWNEIPNRQSLWFVPPLITSFVQHETIFYWLGAADYDVTMWCWSNWSWLVSTWVKTEIELGGAHQTTSPCHNPLNLLHHYHTSLRLTIWFVVLAPSKNYILIFITLAVHRRPQWQVNRCCADTLPNEPLEHWGVTQWDIYKAYKYTSRHMQ